MAKISIGSGASISVTIGANIVKILATILQTPNAVEEYMAGNKWAQPKNAMLKVPETPNLLANTIIAIYTSLWVVIVK